jgi:predicted MFS family arabinose efflux permease
MTAAPNAVRLVLTALLPFALGYLLSFLFRSINAVSAPAFRADLGLGSDTVGLLTSAYFLGFSLAQLPLGIALDRFGPRRCSAVLLIVAAVGSLVFGLADDLAGLTLGRALIGLGVSVALMAAFKANALFWPLRFLPTVNACTMTFGGLGAAAATLPVQWALGVTDWRTLFLLLAGATVAVALYQWLAVPERPPPPGTSWQAEGRALMGIVRSPLFWVAALAPTFSLSVWMTYNSFWAAPWLREVALLDEPAVGAAMLAVSLAIIIGYFFSGVIVDALARRGVPGGAVLLAYGVLFLLIQVPVTLNVTAAPALLWFLWVTLGGAPVVIYALLTRSFPAAVAGRVNTTANMVCLGSAFVLQAAIGPALGLAEHQLSRAEAHQAVCATLLALQCAAWLWFALDSRARGLR